MKTQNFIKAVLVLTLMAFSSALLADKGVGKKSKARTNLNITTTRASLKGSVLSNMHTGMYYKGSLLTTRRTAGNTLINSSLTTYQKGNITYIIPYKNRVAVPDLKPGYTGLKLIIRSNK